MSAAISRQDRAEYDDANIFARILRGEAACDAVYEDEYALAFHDIRPQAPVHVVVIPKGRYVNFDDFSAHASAEEIAGLARAVGHVARIAGTASSGYRIISNIGRDAGQSVPHFHVHVLGGRLLPCGCMSRCAQPSYLGCRGIDIRSAA